jgi:hypothetical protein
MNESLQKIVTDLMQRQPPEATFLPTNSAIRLAESNVSVAVSALVWHVVVQGDDREVNS